MLLECVGAKSTGYSPGLTLEPKTHEISIEATYAPCEGTAAVTSAREVHSVTKTASCLSLGEANSGTQDYIWNTGESSSFAYEVTVTRPAGNLVTTKRGAIVGGKFAGATVVEVAVGVTPSIPDCLSPGRLKTVGSTLTLTIAQL